MSSRNSTDDEIFAFIERFVEICGSSQPADIARSFNISYQAAKNYLNGRLPDSNVLLTISKQTPYSIHWLLTGQGKKFVETSIQQDTLPLSDQLREFVRRECRELVNEILSNQDETAQPKTVVLTSGQIMEEKVMEEKTATFSKKER
jgi:predicted transcriptional regulator